MDWTRGGDDWMAEVAQHRQGEAVEARHDAYHDMFDRDPECDFCAPATMDDLRDEVEDLEGILEYYGDSRTTRKRLEEKRAALKEMEEQYV